MKNFVTLLIIAFNISNAGAQKIWNGPLTGGNWAIASNWSGNSVPASNDIVIFPTGINGTISNINGGNNITLGGLLVQGNSVITLTNSTNKTITIANGAGPVDFGVESGANLTISTNVNLRIASGTAANKTSSLIAGTFIISANRFFDTDNSNVITSVTGTIQNSGNIAGHNARLLFQNGAFYVHSRPGGFIPYATWNTNATCLVTGLTNSDPVNDNQAFGNLVYDCPGMISPILNIGANGLSIAGNLEIINTGSSILRMGLNNLIIDGDLILKGGILRVGDNTNRSISVLGNVSIEGGILQLSTGVSSSDRGVLNVSGNFSQISGLITETSSGRGTINFNGNTIQTFFKNVTAIISNNIDFNINSGAIVNFGYSILNGSTGTFTLHDNAKLITENNNGFNGNGGNNGSIQVTGTKTFSSLADYEFRGNATGQFSTSNNPQVRNFTVNNPSGSVTLSQPVIVNGLLNLTAGYLSTSSSNLLTISSTGTTSAATNSSFVDGPIAKDFAAPLTGFTFPIGKMGAGFRNIGITAPSAASTFRAEFFRAAPPAGTIGAGINRLSACEYWELTRTAGVSGTSARVILSWTNDSPCSGSQYVTDQTTLKVAHLAGGTWVNEGYLTSTGNPASGTITSGNILNSFSPFALAGSGSSDNPLAVMYSNVKAFQKDGGIQVEWTNLSEKDVLIYSVERSINGIDFTSIHRQSPVNNQNNEASYTVFDAHPFSGTNYYRIKAQELSGKEYYSRILNVNNSINKRGLNVYPNPVLGNTITINLSSVKRGKYDLQIVNVSGQVIDRQSFFCNGNQLAQTIYIPKTMHRGVYNFIVTGDGYRENKKVVFQ